MDPGDTISSIRPSKKRSLKRDDSDEISREDDRITNEEFLKSDLNHDSRKISTAPRKKPRQWSYREPENLPSFDPEGLKSLFETQPQQDSQPSGLDSWSLPINIVSSGSSSSTVGDNLESLGEIIQKYSYATLDSMKDFGLPTEDTGGSANTISQSAGGSTGSMVNTTGSKRSQIYAQQIGSTDTISSVQSGTQCSEAFNKHEEGEPDSYELVLSNSQEDHEKGAFEKRSDYKRNCDRFSFSGMNNQDPRLVEYNSCEVNPGHGGFYVPQTLQVKNLPREIQNEDSLTFFNCISQLVVQITVTYTSAARGPKDEYSEFINTNKTRYGSGFVGAVDEQIMKLRCKRDNCFFASEHLDSSTMSSPNTSFDRSSSFDMNANLSSPNTNSPDKPNTIQKHFFYGGVTVHTSRHVIFDKSEADNAFVKFFFVGPDGQGVVNGHVAAIVGVNSSQDHMTLHVMSHDKNVFNVLPVVLANAKSSYKEMLRSTIRAQHAHGLVNKESWVALISHPHGMPKRITLGRVRKEIEDSDGIKVKKYYDAPACNGSSGGLVMTPSLLKLQWPGAVHSSCDINTGFNVTLDSRSRDLDFVDIGRINKNLIKK
ncbi:unnamed protein product [Lymnaea stagnalis]|uniref:Uncharacterized protein n=1 Tax=Lymnaea stagnalis TaxID=6523 RepID=A0AAV2HP54_LYMST